MTAKEINEKLRALGKLSQTEIFLQEGDLFIAKDVLTNNKRIIQKDQVVLATLNENKRTILKG